MKNYEIHITFKDGNWISRIGINGRKYLKDWCVSKTSASESAMIAQMKIHELVEEDVFSKLMYNRLAKNKSIKKE